MTEKKKIVILITRGLDDERSSVAWSIANGGIKSGMEVTLFLTSSGVDWVRKGAADNVHLNPFDPSMKEMIDEVMNQGCEVLACPPCVAVRNYKQEDLLPGVIITGSLAMHEKIKQGAATLCF